jgi:methylenetetrahydrofolate reductase (NADPH)
LLAGAAVDPQLGSWSGLVRRFERKLEAGAQFFQSQLITDFDRLDKFMNEVGNAAVNQSWRGFFCSSRPRMPILLISMCRG